MRFEQFRSLLIMHSYEETTKVKDESKLWVDLLSHLNGFITDIELIVCLSMPI